MSPIFVAIDTADLSHARSIAELASKQACGVKLGLQFFCANGPEGIREIAKLGAPVFLDLKFHDIPNTVAKAIQALAPIAPAVLTVHAAGGRAMLEAAKAAAPAHTKVVAVTVLTSLDETDLQNSGVIGAPADQVRRLAALSQASGLDGIVCSGAELAAAREAWPAGYFVVPGVRPMGAEAGDQKRIVTPRQALADGASMLVIGRPITGASDPAEALRAINSDLMQAEAIQ